MKRIGLIIALLGIGLCIDISAHAPFIKLFPIVRKLTPVGNTVKQDWYVLLGRNTGKKYEYDYERKQFLYKKGFFSELVMTPKDLMGGYIFNRNPNIASVTGADLFTLLSTVTYGVYRDLDVFEKTMNLASQPIQVAGGNAYFVLLNYDYPLELLNTQATGSYKDSYIWMNVATLVQIKIKPQDIEDNNIRIEDNNIQADTAKIFQDYWLQVMTTLQNKLRS